MISKLVLLTNVNADGREGSSSHTHILNELTVTPEASAHPRLAGIVLSPIAYL